MTADKVKFMVLIFEEALVEAAGRCGRVYATLEKNPQRATGRQDLVRQLRQNIS